LIIVLPAIEMDIIKVFESMSDWLIIQLNEHTSNIAIYLNDFERNFQQIEIELIQTEAILKNMRVKISGNVRQSVNKAIKLIEAVRHHRFDKDSVREVYFQLHLILEEGRQREEDMKWES